MTMRKLMMVAAAAAIALVGLSANTCGGGRSARDAARDAAGDAPGAIDRNAARALI
jgi:hypothetical protein